MDVKLKYLDEHNSLRRKIAERYVSEINNPKITLPVLPPCNTEHVWHLFVIQTKERETLQKYLLEHGIQTIIHYPIPPHQQECYKEYSHLSFPITEQLSQEVISLPISQVMTDEEIDFVIKTLNTF